MPGEASPPRRNRTPSANSTRPPPPPRIPPLTRYPDETLTSASLFRRRGIGDSAMTESARSTAAGTPPEPAGRKRPGGPHTGTTQTAFPYNCFFIYMYKQLFDDTIIHIFDFPFIRLSRSSFRRHSRGRLRRRVRGAACQESAERPPLSIREMRRSLFERHPYGLKSDAESLWKPGKAGRNLCRASRLRGSRRPLRKLGSIGAREGGRGGGASCTRLSNKHFSA